jgi:hypothetical protein
MKASIHFFQVNSDFSIEHAEAHYNGEESENNLKHDWEDEFEVSHNLESVEIIRKGTFHLQGQLPNGDLFKEPVENMFLIAMTLTDGQIGYMGVSESMLMDFSETKEENHVSYKVYIKDYEPCWNEMPGLFIAAKEFPKNLKLHDRD